MHIVFITNGSIGDAVISTGIIAHLVAQYPDARFTIAAGPASAPLFEGFPSLERLLVIRKQTRNRHWWHLWRQLRGRRWDLVVDLRSSLIAYLLRARRRIVFRGRNTAISKRLQYASLFGVATLPAPRIWVGDPARVQARTLVPDRPYFVFVPKSNAAYKDWPADRFAELGNRLLAKTDRAIVILALASQKDAIAPLIAALPPERVIDLSGKTDLAVASAVCEKADCVIANDSGLLHIAAALGTKIVGLYGPTNDTRYAPVGPGVTLVKARDFTPEEEEIRDASIILGLSVDQVEAAIFSATSSAE